MRLEQVVPWGRTLAEYRGMFALTATDLAGTLLGCGDGPASFNSEATALGGQVISIDPVYAFGRAAIKRRVQETYATILAQVKQDMGLYVWTHFADADALGRARLAAMEGFLADYPAGRAAGRYLPAALPWLPFPNGQFDLSLCSHLLFLYAEQLSLDFHLQAVAELLRVSREVRIFPLLDLLCRESAHLRPVIDHFTAQGYDVEVVPVPYEFQRGGDRMLRLARAYNAFRLNG